MNYFLRYLWEIFTESYTVICIALSFIVPFAVYKINAYIHEHGDAPWKKEENHE